MSRYESFQESVLRSIINRLKSWADMLILHLYTFLLRFTRRSLCLWEGKIDSISYTKVNPI